MCSRSVVGAVASGSCSVAATAIHTESFAVTAQLSGAHLRNWIAHPVFVTQAVRVSAIDLVDVARAMHTRVDVAFFIDLTLAARVGVGAHTLGF